MLTALISVSSIAGLIGLGIMDRAKGSKITVSVSGNNAQVNVWEDARTRTHHVDVSSKRKRRRKTMMKKRECLDRYISAQESS
jgi:hypothetical protein